MKFKRKKIVENKEIKNQKDLVDGMDLKVKSAEEKAKEEVEENEKVFKDALKQCSLVEGFNYTEDKGNYSVNIKNRAELAKLIESLKQNNIKHRISRSKVEGYKYDVMFKYSLNEGLTYKYEIHAVDDKDENKVYKVFTDEQKAVNYAKKCGIKCFIDKVTYSDDEQTDSDTIYGPADLEESSINQTTREIIKQKGNNTPITDEDQKKEFEAEDENNWNESLDKNNLKNEIKDACKKAFKEVFNFDDEDVEESLNDIDIEVQDYKDMANQPCIRVVLGNGYLTRRGLEKLCKYVENNVLSKYDKDAYFEGEDISSYSAIIRFKEKDLKEANLANSTLKKGDKVRLDKEHNSNIKDKSLLDDEYEVIGFWNDEKVIDDDKAPEKVRDLSGIRIRNTRTGKQYSVNRYQLTSIDESLKEDYYDNEIELVRDGEQDDEYVIIEGTRDGYGIDQVEDSTITVRDLINYLSDYNDNTKVIIGNDWQRGSYYTYGSINDNSIKKVTIVENETEEDEYDESLKESPIQDRLDELKKISRQRALTDDEVKELAELSRRKNELLKENEISNDDLTFLKSYDISKTRVEDTANYLWTWVQPYENPDFAYAQVSTDKKYDKNKAITLLNKFYDLLKIKVNDMLEEGKNSRLERIEKYYENHKQSNESLNESDEDYDKDWDLEEFDDDEVLMYQMPKDINLFYLKNEIKLNSANIEYVGKVSEEGVQPGDYVIKGTKKDLIKFLDDAFDYKMHPDYVYREDEFNTDLLETLEETKKSRKQLKWRYNGNPEASAQFIANGTNLAGQAVCESDEEDDEDTPLIDKEDKRPYTERRKDTLRKIKQNRSLTDDEYEELAYCDNEVSSRDAEARYLNGESLKESDKEDKVVEDDIEEISLDDIDIDEFDNVDLDNVSIDDIVDEDEEALDILKDKLDIEIIEDEDSPILSIKEKGNNEKKAPELKVEVEQEEADKINNTFNKEEEEVVDEKENTNLPATTDEDEVNFDEIVDAEPIDAKKALASLKGVSLVDKPEEKDNNKSEDEEEFVDVEDDDMDDTSFLDKIA